MNVTYFGLCNLTGITCSILALISGLLYYRTTNRFYLVITASIQTFFIIEIVNIQLKRNKSRCYPALMALSRRIFYLWVIAYYFKYLSIYLLILIGCWYLSDLLRYAVYSFTNNHTKKVGYTILLVTYLVASYCEIASFYDLIKANTGFTRWALTGVLIGYVPGFVFLLRHRLQQRYWTNKKYRK
ncbi:hypothetical protein NBO_398g0006 [Nosema bombycis CQ1]|uniref:very-long-chain (3R)-3-hydroxyacyl-CoA dehydratase n=1 Tax=Nosema bombycis (strain CQ1 / CVCC 102059) TaxID=578461 RepID=R0MIH7_NOSB1|nr:hypothetical protein NBO_398g0006 [Nosema bombycis CQ1]|eukprot:EOB12608.1 hypothetical protein NBO_398g0006 [Nosema bombycis CQ1]